MLRISREQWCNVVLKKPHLKMKSIIIHLILIVPWNVSAFRGNYQWWRGAEIYDIYVPSYKDSNNDGIGDINGVTSKLPYLKELGIEIIKLSTIFDTAEKNTFYFEGVTNYREIDPLLGTMNDFENLIRKANEEEIKVVIDLPISNCHKSHEWFQKSRLSITPYKYYFVWKLGDKSVTPPKPPTQALSHDGDLNKSAWTFDTKRRKFYYHWFHNSLPDLNLRNKMVKKEMKNIVNFWLDKGVAGFNLLTSYAYAEALFLKEEMDMKDDDLLRSISFLRILKKTTDEYSENRSDYQRIIIIEASRNESITSRYLGTFNSPLAHIISKDDFAKNINPSLFITSDELDAFLNPTIKQIQQGRFFEWVTERPTTKRLASQFNQQIGDLIIFILAMLPGTMRIFYGQEIGMSDPSPKYGQESYKPYWSSFHPSPMQWNKSLNAGFTSKIEPYVTLNSDYWNVNVEQQQQDSLSSYHMLKDLLQIRRTDTLKYGDIKSYIISKNIYAFKRSFHRHETYLTIVNLSNEPQMILTVHPVFEFLPETLRVVAATANSAQQKGYMLDSISPMILRPLSGVVVTSTNEM